MSIPYTPKINERLVALPIASEPHLIGITGTITYTPAQTRLVEVPEGPGPAVTIPGFTEILSGTPTGSEFIVDYITGVITFSSISLDGTAIVASYSGLGSEIAGEDVNELQNPLSAIVTQNVTYHWPSAAPTVTWTLAGSIITDVNISPSASISLSKLQALNPNIVPITNGSGILTSSITTATELGYLHGVTSSIQAQLDSKQSTGNYLTDLIGAVTTSNNSSSSVLATAATYAVLGDSTVTNTGSSVLTGDLGNVTASSITGFPPGVYTGTLHSGDAAAAQANTDANTAYTAFAALLGATVLTGDLGGRTLTPGVYKYSSSAALTGILTLDAAGDPNAQFVFQIGSTLTTATGSTVSIINSGLPGNVYWQVGSSATLGVGSSFSGTILALASVTANTSASVAGRLIALTGAVTLDDNAITVAVGSGGLAVTTLATVNTDVGSFTNADITVNAQGLITAASNGAPGTTIHADASPALSGAVQLISGTNIILSQVGQAITINSAAASSGITGLIGDVTTTAFNPILNSASSYAALGNSTVTNTGSTVLNGNLGIYPGTSITGFPPGTFTGVENINNSFAAQAQTDANSAYAALAAMSFTTDLTGMILGTGGVISTLSPGVYKFTSTAQLIGTLTLDAGGNPAAQWVFQIGSTLITASASSIVIINSGIADNVYWNVGTSATLGTTTSFQGTILAMDTITANTGASVQGRLIALTGAVTLDDNAITVSTASGGVEIATLATVNPDVGSFTNPIITVNGKGLITSITNGPTAADVALDNLSGVAINTSLLPGVDNVISLGDSSLNFEGLFVKGVGIVFQQTGAGTNAISIVAPSSVTSYNLVLPLSQGGPNTVLTDDGSGNLSWASVGGISLIGDVTTSPSSSLLSASSYAVLANSTITNTGATALTGDLGIYPGTSITGFPPGTFTGVENINNSFAAQAQTDANSAYTSFSALPITADLSGMNLGGMTLTAGVYKFSSIAALTTGSPAILTLDAGGNANAQWIFQIGSTLTTATSSEVVLINGGVAGNIYWLVGSSATLGTSSAFQGTIIAAASVTANTGASVQGRLIALTGAVTLDDNAITVPAGSVGVEVATLATVNSDVGTFTNATITVNGKGLVTSASNGTALSYTAGTGLTLTGTVFSLTNPVTVALGGTGLATLTAHNVILGEGTSNVAFASPSTAGFVLTSNGPSADPTFQASSGGVASLNSLTGALNIVGTTDEIIVTPAGTSITLSTPQAIGTTSSPTFSQITASTEVIIGTSNSVTGELFFDNASNGNFVGIQSGVTTTSYTLILPLLQGAASTVLTNDGSGNLSWSPVTSGVTSITGTANQVIASASTGAITLSLPQSIATTSTPTFSDLTLTDSSATTLDLSSSGGITLTTVVPSTNASATAGNILGTTSNVAFSGAYSGTHALTGTSITLSTGNSTGAWSSHIGGSSYAFNGGGITLTTGDSTSNTIPVSVTGGSLLLTTGNASGSASGGGIILTTGVQGISLTASGGSLLMTTADSGNGPLNGGNITLTCGNASFANYSSGGSLTLTSGTSLSSSTFGGGITLTSGQASGTSDTGGSITLTSYTPANGGNLTLTGTSTGFGQICVGGTSPNATASVDIQSTTRGFLQPRMTATQRTAISSPAEGLMVYDTTSHQFMGWNGSSWVILG